MPWGRGLPIAWEDTRGPELGAVCSLNWGKPPTLTVSRAPLPRQGSLSPFTQEMLPFRPPGTEKNHLGLQKSLTHKAGAWVSPWAKWQLLNDLIGFYSELWRESTASPPSQGFRLPLKLCRVDTPQDLVDTWFPFIPGLQAPCCCVVLCSLSRALDIQTSETEKPGLALCLSQTFPSPQDNISHNMSH